jgi:NAD-dependent SIR2 family protein deacetylase
VRKLSAARRAKRRIFTQQVKNCPRRAGIRTGIITPNVITTKGIKAMQNKEPIYIIAVCLDCGSEFMQEDRTDSDCPFCPDCRKYACAACGICTTHQASRQGKLIFMFTRQRRGKDKLKILLARLMPNRYALRRLPEMAHYRQTCHVANVGCGVKPHKEI